VAYFLGHPICSNCIYYQLLLMSANIMDFYKHLLRSYPRWYIKVLKYIIYRRRSVVVVCRMRREWH